ncbi:peptidase C25 [Bacteroidia bacterium]|nr:peptidase C25 [Bacteroidia bacterium]
MGRRIFFLFWLVGLSCLFAYAANGDSHAGKSELATGHWVRIQVENTGMFKLTYADLRKMGFSDPSKVSVHGYGGWPLDENFNHPCIDDVPAVTTYRGADYLIFYGKGPVKWEYNPSTYTFVHTNNPYSMYGSYFLTDATDTKEMETLASTESGAALAINVYDEYRVHEKDLYSVNESGRELFGESFPNTGSQTITSSAFQIPGITDDDAKVTMRFIAHPISTRGQASLSIGGQSLIDLYIQQVGIDDTYTKARAAEDTQTWTGEKSENPRVAISYNIAGDDKAHLDYIRLHVKRTLKQYGDYTFFRSIASIGNISRFVLQNANQNTMVFDVTDGINLKRMETQLNGLELSFSIPAGGLREFVAVQINQNLTGWTSAGEVRNQDLHAMEQTDMVIIVQDGLRNQAERLAERHRKDNLRVEIVNPQHIYNEFSSGTPDATAYRRFMKMLYDRATSEADKPKYLLLFGDGAFDNRKLTSEWKQQPTTNMLLTYQSENSLNQYSYVTDDYFGALENTPFQTGPIQLGIGRFPVRNLSEAMVTVDKVLAYMDNTQTGNWKNRLCFVADDGNAADRYSLEHMDYANQLGDTVRANHPEFMVNKIFFDAYKKSSSTYPDVHDNILKHLKDGLLLINYTGHGSTQKWSDESVLTAADISRFSYPNLPLWITATCDFTRFDAIATSAGEMVFLQKSGGIAMLTTTRVVYSNDNFNLNSRVLKELFRRDASGHRLALGDVVRNTKAALYDTNKYNFILIGDPAMKLAYPEYRMQVTSINGEPVQSGKTVSVKALEKVTVRGEILTPDGSTTVSDFSGTLSVTVFDSKQARKTLNNNNTGETLSFTDYPNRLYVGNDVVQGGQFEFSFTTPSDILYSNDYGLMNLYAVADDGSGTEAQGAFDNFIVGGEAENPEMDTNGPEIRQIFLNDSTFTDGGQVNTTPFFVARLWDKTGVNISGGSIGHDIVLSIDNKPSLSYNLNSYYHLLPGSGGEGIVQFSIPALTPGLHTAEFKAWDVMNNPTLYTFSFEVVEGLKPAISSILAMPVPARENVQFRIYHNSPETSLQVSVMVYDMTGRRVWSTEGNGSSTLYSPYTVDWDLTSSGGSRLRPGIYIYRAAIRTATSKEVTESKKLIILAQ